MQKRKLGNSNLEVSAIGLGCNGGPIAVGMLITEHPPHRSRRAYFTHRAPTLGDLRRSPRAAPRTQSSLWDTLFPTLSPARVLLSCVPLGPLPWLRRLRARSAGFVRQIHRYYEEV